MPSPSQVRQEAGTLLEALSSHGVEPQSLSWLLELTAKLTSRCFTRRSTTGTSYIPEIAPEIEMAQEVELCSLCVAIACEAIGAHDRIVAAPGSMVQLEQTEDMQTEEVDGQIRAAFTSHTHTLSSCLALASVQGHGRMSDDLLKLIRAAAALIDSSLTPSLLPLPSAAAENGQPRSRLTNPKKAAVDASSLAAIAAVTLTAEEYPAMIPTPTLIPILTLNLTPTLTNHN